MMIGHAGEMSDEMGEGMGGGRSEAGDTHTHRGRELNGVKTEMYGDTEVIIHTNKPPALN